MCCLRRMEKVNSTDRLRNGVLQRVVEQRNILRTMKRREANRIGAILRRNWLLKRIIEGKIEGRIEVTRRRGRRLKQLLNDFKETREYCKLKDEALDRSVWRTCFGRCFGSVVRQIAQ